MAERRHLAGGAVRAVAEHRVSRVGGYDRARLVFITGIELILVRERLNGSVNGQRLLQSAAESRDAGAAGIGRRRVNLQLFLECGVHHRIQRERKTLVGLIVFQRERVVHLIGTVADTHRQAHGRAVQFDGLELHRQQPLLVLVVVEADLVANILVRALGVARPVERQCFAVDKINGGNLELGHIQIDDIGHVIDRIIAQTFRAAGIVVAPIHIQPCAGGCGGLAGGVGFIIQAVARRAVENRVHLTARYIDFDADCGIQHTFIVGIILEQLGHERSIAVKIVCGILALFQTDAIDTAVAGIVHLVPLVELALALDLAAECFPLAARAIVCQRGLRRQIHGLGIGFVLAELRKMDIAGQIRHSNGKKNAHNDQRYDQLHHRETAFFTLCALLCHRCCLLSARLTCKWAHCPNLFTVTF